MNFVRPSFKRALALIGSLLIGVVYSEVTKPVLRYRYRQRKDFPESSESFEKSVFGLERCAVSFINLDRRPDRREEMVAELEKLGLENYNAFRAIEASPGSLGCSLSHAALLQVEQENSDLIMVCEDDARFLLGRKELDEIVEAFYLDLRLDLLCLSYKIQNSPLLVDDKFAISNNIQTTACYIVRRQHVSKLSKVMNRSANRLARGWPEWFSALDIAWKALQRWELIFAIPQRPCVIQRASFSDVEGRTVDYWGPSL